MCADEMLYPENYRYLSDILSYVAVGARSVEDQEHRLTASGMECPCGMKNPTSGTISIMLNSIRAAQSSHTFIYRGWEVNTDGNPLAHAILRGAQNKHDQTIPNTFWGNVLYFAMLGLLTAGLRLAAEIETVSFSILIMNIICPLIDRYIVPRPFGKRRERKAKEAKA